MTRMVSRRRSTGVLTEDVVLLGRYLAYVDVVFSAKESGRLWHVVSHQTCLTPNLGSALCEQQGLVLEGLMSAY